MCSANNDVRFGPIADIHELWLCGHFSRSHVGPPPAKKSSRGGANMSTSSVSSWHQPSCSTSPGIEAIPPASSTRRSLSMRNWTVESCPSYIVTYLVLLRGVFVGWLHCQKLCCFKLELLDLAAACGAPRDDVEIEPARRVGRRTSNLRFLIGAAANVRPLSPCAFASFTANPKNHKIKIQMALSC